MSVFLKEGFRIEPSKERSVIHWKGKHLRYLLEIEKNCRSTREVLSYYSKRPIEPLSRCHLVPFSRRRCRHRCCSSEWDGCNLSEDLQRWIFSHLCLFRKTKVFFGMLRSMDGPERGRSFGFPEGNGLQETTFVYVETGTGERWECFREKANLLAGEGKEKEKLRHSEGTRRCVTGKHSCGEGKSKERLTFGRYPGEGGTVIFNGSRKIVTNSWISFCYLISL